MAQIIEGHTDQFTWVEFDSFSRSSPFPPLQYPGCLPVSSSGPGHGHSLLHSSITLPGCSWLIINRKDDPPEGVPAQYSRYLCCPAVRLAHLMRTMLAAERRSRRQRKPGWISGPLRGFVRRDMGSIFDCHRHTIEVGIRTIAAGSGVA